MSIVATPTPDTLEADLTNILSSYENGEISVINLSAVTSFSWDRLYVFGAYTPSSTLNSALGWFWRDTCSTDIEVLEAATLLAFTYKGKVVHCLDYPTERYDFSRLENLSGISIQDSFFLLDGAGYLILANSK